MDNDDTKFFTKMTLVGALDNLFDYLLVNEKDFDDYLTKEEQKELLGWIEKFSDEQNVQQEGWTGEEIEAQLKEYVKFLFNATKGESKHG